MQRINLPGVSSKATGRSIVIADINAKVDVGHPALVGHLTSGAQFLAGTCSNTSTLAESAVSFLDESAVSFLDESAVSFLDQSSASFIDGVTASSIDKMAPAHGHGTMVAGILAAIAPDAMIMPLQAFDDNGCASIYNISKAINYAVTHGAQVINMSFGVSTDSQTLKDAVKDAVKAGVTVVAAAGNNNTSEPQYPADYHGVISVAATDLKDVKASFSNYGRTITVSAPGVGIISAYPGGYYAAMSGTSFSAPMVAAEAALCRSLRTSDCNDSIINGVDNINAVNPGYINQLGSGRIDLVKALQ
jgi:subtilisin family serine protease